MRSGSGTKVPGPLSFFPLPEEPGDLVAFSMVGFGGFPFISEICAVITREEIPRISACMMECGSFDDEALDLLCSLLRRREVARRELLVAEGLLCGKAFFIERGMTRSYWLVDGSEVTTSFSTEGHIVFSMDEVYYNKPSQEYVEAVEKCISYELSLQSLHDLIGTDIRFSRWWGHIHQREYRRLHQSHKERLTLSASERYVAFARQFPEVCRRGRLSDIASYLGITLSTLSRVRRNFF